MSFNVAAFQQVSLSRKFCRQPGDIHARLQGRGDGHALYLSFGLCHYLRPGPFCARVLLQLSGKNINLLKKQTLWLNLFSHDSLLIDRFPQLFDLVIREETLLNVIKSVTRNGRSIILTAVLAIFLVYFFSIIGFLFLKDDFRMEVDRLPAPGQNL